MTLYDEWRDVLRNLLSQKFRAFLTLLGIILGVSTLIVLSSAVEGSGKFMARRMQQASGEDIISLSKRWRDEGSGKAGIPLSRFDSRALANAPKLEGAQVLNRYSMRVPWGDRWGQHLHVVGTVPEALSFYDLAVEKGRFIAQADVFSMSKVAVLGAEAVKKLLPDEHEPIGKEVKLKGQRFKVVGVLKKKPAMGFGMFTWDGSAIVSEPCFVQRFAQSKELNEIVVKAPPIVAEQQGFSRIIYAVRAIVTGRHHGVQNFNISDPLKNAESQRVMTLIVGGLEGAVAGVCLLVGGINVMNIMLVTVSQRTREIGLRRAIGATKEQIRRQFLMEAAILSGIGGLVGVVGGTAIAWLLSQGLTMAFGYWPFVFVPFQTALGFGFALLTGVVFGWYPASMAANLDPIECLRYE